jgi:hypothetical protein
MQCKVTTIPSSRHALLKISDIDFLIERLRSEFGPALNGAPPTVIRDAIDRRRDCRWLTDEAKNALVELIRGCPD